MLEEEEMMKVDACDIEEFRRLKTRKAIAILGN